MNKYVLNTHYIRYCQRYFIYNFLLLTLKPNLRWIFSDSVIDKDTAQFSYLKTAS